MRLKYQDKVFFPAFAACTEHVWTTLRERSCSPPVLGRVREASTKTPLFRTKSPRTPSARTDDAVQQLRGRGLPSHSCRDEHATWGEEAAGGGSGCETCQWPPGKINHGQSWQRPRIGDRGLRPRRSAGRLCFQTSAVCLLIVHPSWETSRETERGRNTNQRVTFLKEKL